MKFLPQWLRTPSMISNRMRERFSSVPPYSSSRRLNSLLNYKHLFCKAKAPCGIPVC